MIIKDEEKKNNLITIIIVFFTTFFVYLHNLSPSVYGGDSGDLITAAFGGGVPHPSGYPLFTMLGVIFTRLPIPATIAWKFGLVSSIFSSATVVLVYLIAQEFTKNRYISVITAFTLAFTYPFWLFAEIVEVMALNSFFISLLIYFTVRYIKVQKNSFLYLLAFFTGLSLTNNLSIILIFPAIGLTLLITNKKLILDYKIIIKCTLLLFLGLAPYLYIPIATAINPQSSWGAVVNIDNFLTLVMRKEYGWLPQSEFNPEIPITKIKSYIDYWISHINLLMGALVILGVLHMTIRKKYKIMLLLLLSYIMLGPFILIYPRNPITSYLVIATFEKFYIAGFIILVLFIPFGLVLVKDLISKLVTKRQMAQKLFSVALITTSLLPTSNFITNFYQTDLSDIYIGDNYAYDIITSLPENSNLLLLGDNEIFNTEYIKKVNNIRGDVYLPGRQEGLRGLLETIGLTEKEIIKYQTDNLGRIQIPDLYQALPILVKQKPTFSDIKFEDIPVIDEKLGKLTFIPYGIVYQLKFENNFNLDKKQYLSKVAKFTNNYHLEELTSNFAFTDSNLINAEIRLRYALAFYKIGMFIVSNYEDVETANVFFEKALNLDPLGLIIK